MNYTQKRGGFISIMRRRFGNVKSWDGNGVDLVDGSGPSGCGWTGAHRGLMR